MLFKDLILSLLNYVVPTTSLNDSNLGKGDLCNKLLWYCKKRKKKKQNKKQQTPWNSDLKRYNLSSLPKYPH